MSALRLKISTIKGVVFDEDVDSVYLVAETGAMGILPNRLPIIAALKKTGSVVKINRLDHSAEFYAIQAGALSHKRNETIILAERCEKAANEEAAKERVASWNAKEA